MNRSLLFELNEYRKPFKKAAAIMAAAVLTAAMLAGCKQGESAVQAAENEATVQAAENEATVQAAENGATVQTGQNEAAVQDAGNEAAAQAAESGEYTVRDVKIFDGELTDRTIPLRFYKEAPHVAYMGIREYFDLMLGGGLYRDGSWRRNIHIDECKRCRS